MVADSSIAFKEWSVVVDALATGEQTLILRKGGIHETGGQFQAEHSSFWLFPTLFHESPDAVIPGKQATLLATPATPSAVEISAFATVEEVAKITNLKVLNSLQGRHIWSQSTLVKRFHYGDWTGLLAIIIRVYRLAAPQVLPWQKSYAGCRSWIELTTPIRGTVKPVLDETEFQSQHQQLQELLNGHALAHS